MKFFISTDNRVWIDELVNVADGTAINDAVGTVTLFDDAGTPVSGAQGLTINRAAEDGRYFAEIPSTVVLVEGAMYVLRYELTAIGRKITGQERGRAEFYKTETAYSI